MTLLESIDLADGVYDGDATWEGMIRNPLTSLTAAAIPVKPPSAWFTNPGFQRLEPLTVTADGQIGGHIASWREDHIGMNGRVKAPRSKSGYAFFATGCLETQEGTLVNVGQITLTGGHAPLEASVAEAVAHYDNTDSAFADVAVGEDKHGIWVAGALRPTVDDGALRAIRASSVSGDWRPINGSLEMVAVCAVNVPGFPIPRARVAAGVPVALVAAGTGELVDLMLHQDTTALEIAAASFDDRLRFMENLLLGRIGDSRETLTAAVDAARDAYDEPGLEDRLSALRAAVHPERAVTAGALRDRVHPERVVASALRERVHGGGDAVPFWKGSPALTAATPFAEDMHPRGRDGKFIEKLGIVELFDVKGTKPGQRGKVTQIKPTKQKGRPDILVELQNDDGSIGKTVRVKPDNIQSAPEKARLPGQGGPGGPALREAGNVYVGEKVMLPGDLEGTVTNVEPLGEQGDMMRITTDMGTIDARMSDPVTVVPGGEAGVAPKPSAAPGTVVMKDGTVLEPGSQVKDSYGEVWTVNALEPDPKNPGGGLVELDDGSGQPSASHGWSNVDNLEPLGTDVGGQEQEPAAGRPEVDANVTLSGKAARPFPGQTEPLDLEGWQGRVLSYNDDGSVTVGLGGDETSGPDVTVQIRPDQMSEGGAPTPPKDFGDMTPQEVNAEVDRLNRRSAAADFISYTDGKTPVHRVDAADVKVGDIIEKDDDIFMVQTIRPNPNGVISIFQDTDKERGSLAHPEGFGYMGETSFQPGDEATVLEVGPDSDLGALASALGFSDMTPDELANAKKRRKGAAIQQIIDYEIAQRGSTPGGTLPTPIAPASAVTADALRAEVHDLWDDGMPIDFDIPECLQASLRARVKGGLVARATSAWTAKEREKAAGRGAAMPGGRFPIKDCTDVSKAVRALGRAKGDKAAVKRHIKKRARTLGCMDSIPDGWK